MITSELDLEIDQLHIRLQEVRLQHLVYLKRILFDRLDLLPCGKIQRYRKITVDQRIAQIIIFIGKFYGGDLQRRPLLHTQPF